MRDCAIVFAVGASLAGPVQAGDLSLPAPDLEFMACDSFGEGYRYFPELEACGKISGHVRSDVSVRSDASDKDDTVTFDSEVELSATAVKDTEIGLVTTHITVNSGASDFGDESEFQVEEAWVKFGDHLLIGKTQSAFDFGKSNSIFDD